MTVIHRILCVHQGGELYGSDRSFLQAVQALRAGWPAAHIRVVLAADGPLQELLQQVANDVVVRDLCVLRLANPISTILKSTIAFPWYLSQALLDIIKADLVYINTTVIADYMVASSFAPYKSVIHAREIPKSKAIAIVRFLTIMGRAHIIFNSKATEDAFKVPSDRSCAVIHNGVDMVPNASLPIIPPAFSASRPLRIAMLGRINDWKGQDLLIDAISRLGPDHRENVQVRIVGGTFQDVPGPIISLTNQITSNQLEKIVTLEPFRDDPGEVYRWADVCVVPSRLPEPFGRVAIEAMAYARPVIAASHGGLIEIVKDPDCGWLVKPNDSLALAKVIIDVLINPLLLVQRAEGALNQFSSKFSSSNMAKNLQQVLSKWISKNIN